MKNFLIRLKFFFIFMNKKSLPILLLLKQITVITLNELQILFSFTFFYKLNCNTLSGGEWGFKTDILIPLALEKKHFFSHLLLNSNCIKIKPIIFVDHITLFFVNYG